MQKHEFETLTGMMVDEYSFSRAEDIYLNAGSLTKEEVCKEIKEHPWLLQSETVAAITETAQEQTRIAAKRLVDIEKLKAALLDACRMADDSTAWKGAKELIGTAEVIRYKLGNEAYLDSDDVAYINENLK